jgi:hypothetical protein
MYCEREFFAKFALLIRAKVTTRRCHEWTVDYIKRLVAQCLVGEEALNIAQNHRDPPTHGILGIKSAELSPQWSMD